MADDDEEVERCCKANTGKFAYMYKFMQALESNDVGSVKKLLEENDVKATDTPYFNYDSDFYDMNYNSEENDGHCISVGNFVRFKGSKECQEAIAPLLLKSAWSRGGCAEAVFRVAITPALMTRVCECDESPQDIRCQMFGDYYQTAKILNGKPVFTNGEVYCWYDSSQGAWCWTDREGFRGRPTAIFLKSSMHPTELVGVSLDFKAGWNSDQILSDVCIEAAKTTSPSVLEEAKASLSKENVALCSEVKKYGGVGEAQFELQGTSSDHVNGIYYTVDGTGNDERPVFCNGKKNTDGSMVRCWYDSSEAGWLFGNPKAVLITCGEECRSPANLPKDHVVKEWKWTFSAAEPGHFVAAFGNVGCIAVPDKLVAASETVMKRPASSSAST